LSYIKLLRPGEAFMTGEIGIFRSIEVLLFLSPINSSAKGPATNKQAARMYTKPADF
jgi:hypothetical protein